MKTARAVGRPASEAGAGRRRRVSTLPVDPFGHPLVRLGILCAYGGVMFVTMIAAKWGGGVPVRALLSVALLALLCAASLRRAFWAVKRFRGFLLLTTLISLLGIALSIRAGDPEQAIIKAVIENPLQTAVSLLLTAVVAEYCGARPTLKVFVIVIAVSALVAIAQFVGIESAWHLRESLTPLQTGGQLVQTATDLDDDTRRALGLSFSKITLAGQLCLALAAFYLVRATGKGARGDFEISTPTLLLGFVLFAICSIAGGNRSPVLGGVIFVVLYVLRKNPKVFSVAIPALGVFLLFLEPALELLQSSGLRVFETQDSSALGRITLVHYGIILFRANPLGYGLNFDPTKLWRPFLGYLSGDQYISMIFVYPLHNYVLSMMNMFGVLVFGFVPYVYRIISKHKEISILFLVYIINILFHNEGPFYSELYLWYIIGALPVLLVEQQQVAKRYDLPARRRLSARGADNRLGLPAGGRMTNRTLP